VIHGRIVGLQARVAVTFRRAGQPDLAIEFVVDTGF
jgi:predicted aspartyl protease